MIYDNRFHTIIYGYEDNEAVVNHIWNNMVADNDKVENVVDQVIHK